MSEIKSAIELAMEKTKSLIMNDEEKKIYAIEEMANRIRALLRRYIEGMVKKEDIAEELAGIQGDDAAKQSVFVDVLIEEFDMQGEKMKLVDLFEFAGIGLTDLLRVELETLRGRFEEQLERKEIVARKDIIDSLEKRGISGDAIELNLEEWNEWNQMIEETMNIFKKRISEWKSKLKAANG